MRSLVLALALLGWPLATPSASAHDPAASVLPVQAGHNPAECYCRAQGRLFAQGESVCLRTAEGGRMAECRMETNVMSWGITERRCPET
jgi:hypothetical protein